VEQLGLLHSDGGDMSARGLLCAMGGPQELVVLVPGERHRITGVRTGKFGTTGLTGLIGTAGGLDRATAGASEIVAGRHDGSSGDDG
jgi:hypothetical protein